MSLGCRMGLLCVKSSPSSHGDPNQIHLLELCAALMQSRCVWAGAVWEGCQAQPHAFPGQRDPPKVSLQFRRGGIKCFASGANTAQFITQLLMKSCPYSGEEADPAFSGPVTHCLTCFHSRGYSLAKKLVWVIRCLMANTVCAVVGRFIIS